MDDFQEPLSLGTFEASKAYEPYLNTPRSLEACHMNGINPIELVEIPIGEFQRDNPNDPDMAQRRFERVDGARRRILAKVKSDWHQLCASGWRPLEDRTKKSKETIIPVSSAAHCQLLEHQAEQFRKIEKDNWDALTRKLKMDIKLADVEQRNKNIVQKHKEIEANNANLEKERQLAREMLYKEQLDRLRRKEEDEREEIRRLQALDLKLALEKKDNEELNKVKERERMERKEFDRVQRAQYTKHLVSSIIAGMESEQETKKKLFDIREQSTVNRLNTFQKEREEDIARKKREREERIAKAREEAKKIEDEDREILMEQIRKNEAHRREIAANKEKERVAMAVSNENFVKEKLNKIKDLTEEAVNQKAAKTLQELTLKEELARQELAKVRDAQEKRRRIKAIRQESFKIAYIRAQKQNEYRLMKQHTDLKYKEERSAAIKKGFFALDHMRNSMKDIMEKTNNELREEIQRLKHIDDFAPDSVVESAIQVGKNVLFPLLQKTFGIVDAKSTSNITLQKGADLFPSAFSLPTDDFVPPGTAPAGGTSDGAIHRTGTAATTSQSKTKGRKGFDPLQIQSITQERLASTLKETKQVVLRGEGSPYKRTSTPVPDFSNNFDDDEQSLDAKKVVAKNDSDAAILKLDDLDPYSPIEHKVASTIISSSSALLNMKPKRPNSGIKNRSSADDVQIPMYKFDPLRDGEQAEPMDGGLSSPSDNNDMSKSAGFGPNGKKKLAVIYRPPSRPRIRTDVNPKASYLNPPPGKFRREFSLDHPLAKGGTGKYSKELKNGITPAGLDIPNATEKMAHNSVSETIATANKIEKLTYSAQTRVVDPRSRLEQMKKEQDEELKKIIKEEREAEQVREDVLRSISDAREKRNLDLIFSEERRRASERIIEASRHHEAVIKEAVLQMMELGSRNDNKLPVGQIFHQ